jgi:dihydropteroate synthase
VAAQKGAQIIRVHDVKETVDAVKIINMINAYRNNNER